MRGSQVLIIVLLVAVLGVGALFIARNHAPLPETGTLTVFAPCGLQGPVQMAAMKFREAHPEVPVNVIYDNANVLVRRVLKNGERPDAFISPGELELSQLDKAKLVDQASVESFGTLDMVLIAPAKDVSVTKIEDLSSPKVTAVALGDPQFNSIGLYGEQILRHHKLWETVEPKLMLREFPLEAFKLVAEGKAQAGLAYLSCPLDTNPDKASKSDVRIVQKLDRKSYGPVLVQAGALKTSTRPKKAKVFLDFLLTPDAQQAMAKDGLLSAEALKQ